MAQTLEGRVKEIIKKVLAEFKPIRTWWPVPSGYGESTIDCHAVYKSRSIAIETKKYKGKLSALQKKFLKEHAEAGGISIVIEGAEDPSKPPRNLSLLYHILNNIHDYSGEPNEVYW